MLGIRNVPDSAPPILNNEPQRLNHAPAGHDDSLVCHSLPRFTQPCGTSESQLASVSYTHHPGSSRVNIFYPSPNNDEPSDFSIYIYKIYCCIYIIYVK